MPPVFPPKTVEKQGGMLAVFLHIFGVKISSFFIDFGVIFPPEGSPGAVFSRGFFVTGDSTVFWFLVTQRPFLDVLRSFFVESPVTFFRYW